MEQTLPMRYHKFYVVLTILIYPIVEFLILLNEIGELNEYSYALDSNLKSQIYFALFLSVISVIFSAIVGSQLNNMTAKGYRWNQWLLIYQLFVFTYYAILTYDFKNIVVRTFFTIAVWIYYKKRKALFFDEPETESESPSDIRIEFNHPTIQNQIALNQNEAVPAQPERPTTQNQIQATIDQQESATIQTKQPVSKPSPKTNKSYCRHCGKELLANTSFCRHCGQKSN